MPSKMCDGTARARRGSTGTAQQPSIHTLTRLARGLIAVSLLSLAALLLPVAGASAEVTFPGSPLVVTVGPQGQCQSNYPNHGNNYYPPFSNIGDCGFFLGFPAAGNPAASGFKTGLAGQTYGFNGAAFAGFGTPPLDEYTATASGQSPVSGAGTAASPFVQTTQFEVNDATDGTTKYAKVTETTTYVNGEPQFVSSYTVENLSGSTIFFRAIYAGDLFVNGDDVGTGVFEGGPPRFIGGLNAGSGVVGGFTEVPAPAPEWSAFQELPYPNVWETIKSTNESPHAFNDTIEPNEVDNAAGVEWDQFREPGTGLAAGKSTTFTVINHTSVPSNLLITPVTQTLVQGQTETINVSAADLAGQPYAGKVLHYTVAGANPQGGTVVLNVAGQAQISYVGNNAGIDTTQLFVDLSGSGAQTPGDPAGTATVTFLPRPIPPAPVANSGYKVQSIHANSNGTITIVFVPLQEGTATLLVTVPTATIARNEAIAAKKSKKCKKNQVKLKGKCLLKTSVSGKVVVSGKAGVPLKLTVKPSSKVRKALAKGKTVKLTATLTYKAKLGGKPTVQTFHLKVKAPKKKKHH